MLKQKIEDKAQRTPDSITHDGRTYHKSDFEAPEMPGRTRPGMLFSSLELRLCAGWGLISPSGFDFRAHLPVERPRDPSHVRREDAPDHLIKAAASAWARLEGLRGRIAAVITRRDEAERAWRRAASDQNARVYNRELAASLQAEEERKALEVDEVGPCRDAADAEQAIAHWIRLEANTRAAGQQTAPIVF